MSFWKKSNYTYATFADLPERKVLLLLEQISRQDIIEWLSWNDRNGIYDDAESMAELGNIMSREEGIEIMLRHISEGRPIEQ